MAQKNGDGAESDLPSIINPATKYVVLIVEEGLEKQNGMPRHRRTWKSRGLEKS